MESDISNKVFSFGLPMSMTKPSGKGSDLCTWMGMGMILRISVICLDFFEQSCTYKSMFCSCFAGGDLRRKDSSFEDCVLLLIMNEKARNVLIGFPKENKHRWLRWLHRCLTSFAPHAFAPRYQKWSRNAFSLWDTLFSSLNFRYFCFRRSFFRRKKSYQPYRLGCNQKQQSTTYTP